MLLWDQDRTFQGKIINNYFPKNALPIAKDSGGSIMPLGWFSSPETKALIKIEKIMDSAQLFCHTSRR